MPPRKEILPSSLYENAAAALGPRRHVWKAALQRIQRVDGPDTENESGADVIRALLAVIISKDCLKECQPILINVTREAPASPASFVASGLDRGWLRAAAALSPPPTSLNGKWLDLMRNHPQYAVIAFRAVAMDPDVSTSILPEYFVLLPERGLFWDEDVESPERGLSESDESKFSNICRSPKAAVRR